MTQDDVVVDLRLRIDRTSGKVEISVLSESEQDAANVAITNFFRIHSDTAQDVLKDVTVKSAKTDPKSMKASSRLRPMWEKTTCDIIK